MTFDILDYRKNAESLHFLHQKLAHIIFLLYLCVAKRKRCRIMESAVRHNCDLGVSFSERPLIDPDWRSKPKYSEDEFWNMAYADLGKRYGLNDIREVAQ